MIQIPNYTVKKVIGQGGMALVYLAEQDMLSREVALKVLLPDMMKDDTLRNSFLNEGKIVASLDHPNIVSIFDIGIVDDSIFYMTMEYISGGTLKEKFAEGRISYKGAVKILEEIAEGLAYAHDKGYIHRDIKPGNILFRENGSAVLTDFGIAKLQDSSGDLTRFGLTAGTAQYMSPEQATSSKLDARSDIYSLGLVFFEILAGEKAFKFDTHHQAIHLHTTAPPPKLPKETAFLQTIIDKVLAKKSKDRYQTVSEFVQAIKDAGQPTLTTISTGNTIHSDKTIIHGTELSFVNRIKKKPFLYLFSLLAGFFVIGSIVFSFINYPFKTSNPDEPIKVASTIKQKPTPKPKETSSTPQEKPKTSPKKINNKPIPDTKPEVSNGCGKLPSIVKTLLSAASHEEVDRVDASKVELYHLATKEAFDSTDSRFCASNSLEHQLKIYKTAIQTGDYKTLENFIYPPLKKHKSKETLKKLISPPYLPNDKVIDHTQLAGLSFLKHSKGIYIETRYFIKMVKNLAPSQEALQNIIKKGTLKKAQKKAAKALKKEHAAYNISFKKNTLEATFEKVGSELAIYELDHGWSIMNYDPKVLSKFKNELPKEIVRYLTRLNW